MKTVTDFESIPQDNSQTAWMPVVKMMIRFFGKECMPRHSAGSTRIESAPSKSARSKSARSKSATATKTALHDALCKADMTQANTCLQSLLHLHKLRWLSTGRNRPLTWQQIVIEIDAGRPFVVACNAAHYYVCTGYDPVGHMLLLYNPLPVGRGRFESIPYQDYVSLFNVECLYRFHAF